MRPRMPVLNRFERGGGEAVVEYLDSNLKVIRPGSFVRCAVTGEALAIEFADGTARAVAEGGPKPKRKTPAAPKQGTLFDA